MSINKDFEFNMMIISGCQDCVIMTAEGCLATTQLLSTLYLYTARTVFLQLKDKLWCGEKRRAMSVVSRGGGGQVQGFVSDNLNAFFQIFS